MNFRLCFPLLVAWMMVPFAPAWGEPVKPPARANAVAEEGLDQDFAPADQPSTLAGLAKLLEGLGYEPKQIKTGNSAALQIVLEHANGETRTHLVGIDERVATIFIVGGGFPFAPDPKKATNAWFRKLLKHNNELAPSYLFLNDFDVFGLTTVLGNVNVTPAKLKAKLKDHVTNFDTRLVPLVKELPPMPKNEGENSAAGDGGGVAR